MLCPEIWSFSAPPATESCKTCNCDDDIFRAIKKQLFHHHISITVPDTLQLPKEIISSLIDDSQYYRINEVPVRELFNKEFIDLFLKNGKLIGLSINAISNQDNHLAFIPNGKLILTLSKDAFQKVGIEKTRSCRNSNGLFVLDVISLSANQKKLEEIKNKISHANLWFDIILAWEPEDIKICPSSIAQYFWKKGYLVKTCNIKMEQKVNYNVDVPVFNEESDVKSILEWLGALNLQCKMSEDNYISKYNCLENTKIFGQVFNVGFTGLITAGRVEKLISDLSKLIKEKVHSIWISLVIHGFENSLIGSEQFYKTVGDHYHAIFFKANSPSLVYFFSAKEN